MKYRTTFYLTIAGLDVFAEVDFRVTYVAKPGVWGPPEDTEFEIDEIKLFEDLPSKERKPLDMPQWLEDAIAEHKELEIAMAETFNREGVDIDWID